MKAKTPVCQDFSREVLLVGNPNTGKTTLFNKLTGANEHVGNWHGVTVEEKGKVFDCLGERVKLVDLPGIYSLSALSYEEQVAIDYILAHPKTKIINICDLNNIQRNLALTLGLMEAGADIVLAVNCMDKRPLNCLDYAALQRELKIPVVEINASKGDGLDKLKKLVLEGYNPSQAPSYAKNLAKGENLFKEIKILEHDDSFIKDLPEQDLPPIESIADVANARFKYISSLQKSCIKSSGRTYGKSKFDKIILNRYLAFPIFLLVLAGIFYLTFFSLGKWLSDGLNWLLDVSLGSFTRWACTSIFGAGSWVTHLFCDAIIGGVGTVLGFLPQVVLLFFFLSLLEDSGYLSRVAFASEDIFGKIGLSGKSVYTLLMGFGCSTTAVLTARNMDDKNSKIKTALLTPYMSCSAKFPIYVVIGGAFFGASNVFVIMGLYLLGLVISILLSLIMQKTVLKSKQQSFILEFPPYRFGGFKRLIGVLWDNTKQFLIRVGSLLVSMNIIVWVLSSFSFDFTFVLSSGKMSMLESIGKVIAPIFLPLGFGGYGIASALLAGIVAKEVILTSIATLNGVSEGASLTNSLHDPLSPVHFATPAAALSFLIFSLLYCPCVSTMAVLGKEIGKKWTVVGIIMQLVVGYLVTLLSYNFFLAIEKFGFFATFGVLIAAIVVLLAIFKLIGLFKRKKCDKCGFCK